MFFLSLFFFFLSYFFFFFFFFFNDTATTEIYTLSLHDALPISPDSFTSGSIPVYLVHVWRLRPENERSEEHTSELQSHVNLVCRLLLEKKKKKKKKKTKKKKKKNNKKDYKKNKKKSIERK